MSGDAWTYWTLIAGLSAIAFLSRALFVVPDKPLPLPPVVKRLLRFAPAAALAAIVTPDLFRPDMSASSAVVNPRLVAGLVGFAVAFWSRNILLTMLAGMAMLMIARLAT